MQHGLSLPGARFWRYNYQIIAGAGYWILAIPVAASQVITLWMMALSSDFSQASGTRIGELMTPVLGAFLVAHSLAPEYRSGAGAVLACKPVSLGRVLLMRAGLGMFFALLLTLITLSVCSIGLKPINVWTPLAASIPPLWFLSTLALLFATIFRNPLGGFAVAMAIWSLDFALGFGVHPLLSAQGLSAAADTDPLALFWPTGKAVQMVAGAALWYVHLRQLPRICRPPERREVTRIVVACAAVLAAYCISGAGTVVAYAHARRGNLGARDSIWLRRYLKTYGPAPVARLFGPAFHTLVSEPIPRDNAGTLEVRAQQLTQALERWPGSMWADSIAFELATQRERVDPPTAVANYLAVADRYSRGPYGPKALQAILRMEGEGASDTERLLAARRLLSEYPGKPEAETGAVELRDHYPSKVKAAELLSAAQHAERVAPLVRKPEWLVRQAQMEETLGRAAAARPHAQSALDEAHRLERISFGNTPAALEMRPHMARLGTAAREANELLQRLK